MATIVLALATGWLPLWGAVVGLWLALMAIQMRFHQAAADWQRQLDTIAQLLRAHVLLAGLNDAAAAPLRPDAAAAGKLNRRLWCMPWRTIAGAQEYGDWVLLRNIRHYFASRAVVAAHLPLLRSSFERVATLEADLALARRGPAIFLIDEIFRGTNQLESVSGSAAVPDTLAESGCVLVSSHNLILAPLLTRRLAPLCVARVDGRLQVEPGVLKETNGISLLATVDVDGVLAAKAGRVHDQLAAYYLAYPQACESVLE